MPSPRESLSAVVTLLTSEERGHTLNRRQVLAPDGNWVVFDTRNDDAQIGTTKSIERLHLSTGRIEPIYALEHATDFGPGVGAAAYHPYEEKIMFIHGLHNCCSETPYGVSRRFGALWNNKISPAEASPAEFRIGASHVDGNLMVPSFVPLGVLSGGTHAHSWSPNGQRVSFTYDDALKPSMPRTVGFMTSDPSVCEIVSDCFQAAKPVHFSPAETFAGRFASFLLFEPDHNLGIRKAVEECWVGNHSIAFLGSIRSKQGEEISEIFVADLPSDLEIAESLRSRGRNQVDHVLRGVEFRRLTFLENRLFPGVQGPRHWLVSSPDGRALYFLLRDGNGVVQIAEIGIDSGDLRILTELEHSIEGQISIDPEGRRLAMVSDGKIHIYDLNTGILTACTETCWRKTPDSEPTDESLPYEGSYVGAVHFAGAGNLLVNRYLRGVNGTFLQILRLEI